MNSMITDEKYAINPRKFTLWLLIVGMSMFFIAFISAYVVRRSEGNWEVFNLPSAFRLNVFVSIISSITIQWAVWAAKRDELNQIKIALFITLVLGVFFCYSQLEGWKEMVENNIRLVGGETPSASFVYVISGMHGLHVVGGIIYLIIMFIQSLRLNIHKTNLLQISMCRTYWHFVGVLWIILYLFLLLNR